MKLRIYLVALGVLAIGFGGFVIALGVRGLPTPVHAHATVIELPVARPGSGHLVAPNGPKYGHRKRNM